jgi:DNA replication protein DnaC
MTSTELESEISALGRPTVVWAPRKEFLASGLAQEQWDRAHPEQLVEYRRLCAELDRLANARADAERAEMQAEAVSKRLDDSGVRTRAARSLDAAERPRDSPANLAAREWLQLGRPPGAQAWALMLQGDVGNGKSVSAAWCLLQAAQVMRVAWRSCSEVCRMSAYGDDAADFGRLKRVGLLVLDEVGGEHLTDAARALLAELLNARYEGSLRTVCTANPPVDELEKRLGRRIFDRLRHGGRWVELRGASLRGES